MIQSNCWWLTQFWHSNRTKWIGRFWHRLRRHRHNHRGTCACAKKRFMNYFVCSPIFSPRQEIAQTLMKGLGSASFPSPPPFHFFALNLKLKVIWGCVAHRYHFYSYNYRCAYGTLKPNRGNFLSRPCISFFPGSVNARKKVYRVTNNFIWQTQNSNPYKVSNLHLITWSIESNLYNEIGYLQ